MAELTSIASGSATRTWPEIRDAMPLYNYSRKNIGYLLAMRDGAEVIVETDDDNRPLEDSGYTLVLCSLAVL